MDDKELEEATEQTKLLNTNIEGLIEDLKESRKNFENVSQILKELNGKLKKQR